MSRQKETSTSTAIETIDDSKFGLIAAPDGVQYVKGVIESGARLFDFEQLRMPAGKNGVWTIEGEPKKYIDAIIGGVRTNLKNWYRVPFEESGSEKGPPTCSSSDSVNGFGVNTLEEDAQPAVHDCKTCPWNQFGSTRGKSGKGKDCQDFTAVLLFREGAALPSYLKVPASSFKELRQFMVRDLGNKRLTPYQVVTRFGFQTGHGAVGEFAKLKLELVRILTPQEQERVSGLGDVMKAFLASAF